MTYPVITEGDALEPAFDALAPLGFETDDLGGGLVGLVFHARRTYVVTESEETPGTFLLGVYSEGAWAAGVEALEYVDGLAAADLTDAVTMRVSA